MSLFSLGSTHHLNDFQQQRIVIDYFRLLNSSNELQRRITEIYGNPQVSSPKEEALRFENEFVRHKILDCLGDFSLLGMPVLGHLIVVKSGHAFNHAFLEKFFSQKKSWETCTIQDSAKLEQLQPKSLAI